jgi:hypothetical protein
MKRKSNAKHKIKNKVHISNKNIINIIKHTRKYVSKNKSKSTSQPQSNNPTVIYQPTQQDNTALFQHLLQEKNNQIASLENKVHQQMGTNDNVVRELGFSTIRQPTIQEINPQPIAFAKPREPNISTPYEKPPLPPLAPATPIHEATNIRSSLSRKPLEVLRRELRLLNPDVSQETLDSLNSRNRSQITNQVLNDAGLGVRLGRHRRPPSVASEDTNFTANPPPVRTRKQVIQSYLSPDT